MSVQLKILLTYILSCSTVSGFFYDFSAKYNGTLRPLDPNVCTSQNITFTCTLLSPSVPGNAIGFAVKNESTNKMFLPVSVGQVSVVNDTSSEFTIYNVSASSYMYVRCYYWEIFGNLDESGQLGKTSTVSVYPMPKPVEHFNCIVENYIKSMNCSWKYSTAYKPYGFPYVFCLWKSQGLSWENCPGLNIEYGYCYWNSSLSRNFTMKDIDIKLTLKEPCGVNVSSDFSIDTKKIVKPDPVVGLRSTVLNSTCIRVQWRTNDSQIQYPKEHRVIVSSKWNEPWVSKFTTTADTEKDTHGMTFCDLHPYTVYTFAVSIQPSGAQAGFFSDPRETVATTYTDIPSASPEVTKGGYSWNPRECEGSHARRHVCLFWKPVHEEDKNGPMKGLKGSFMAVTQSKIYFDENWAEDLTYGCSSGLLCNISYVFSIKARNGNGTSETGSALLISAATLGVSLPQIIVEATNGSDVLVSWTRTGKTNGFLVAWCRNKNGACENRNVVDWQIFPPDKREAVLQISSDNSPQDFLFGVSVLTDQGSSGLQWEDCIYLKNAYPKREPQNVVVSTGSEDNTLVVTWDKLRCKSNEPYIDKYNVRYNKLNEKNQNSLNISASGEARVVLEDLDENYSYIVTVRGITKDGHYGPDSQPQAGKPENKSLKLDEIVGIAMGALVVIIFAAVGCVCIVRRCKTRAEQVIKDNDIFIHDDSNLRKDGIENTGVERSSIKSIERQTSEDSGIDPKTPPTEKFVEQPDFVDIPTKQLQQQGRPDDYYYVSTQNGPIRDNSDTPVVQLISINANNTIQPESDVTSVSFVMEENNRRNDEIFVKSKDRECNENERAVKDRVKNVSVSGAYLRESLSGLDRKKNTENKVDVDENIVDDESSLSKSEIINSSFSDTNSKTALPFGNSTLQNISGERCIIPKPSAISEYSGSDNSLSDSQDDIPSCPATNTSAGTSTDYVKAQSTPYLVSVQFSQKAKTDLTNGTNANSNNNQGKLHNHVIQNADTETEPDQILDGISFTPLTSMSRERDMDESNSSSNEEEKVSLPLHPDEFPKEQVFV